jgi:hypothetical protein
MATVTAALALATELAGAPALACPAAPAVSASTWQLGGGIAFPATSALFIGSFLSGGG